MSNEMQYIYSVFKPGRWWFDNNGSINDDGLGTPIRGPYKIGLTKKMPQERLDTYNRNNTGEPRAFRYELLMRVNDCAAAETRVHNILTERGCWCHPDTPGLGTEWFYATKEMIYEIYSTIIRDEFEGEFVDPPLPSSLHLKPEDILDIVKKEHLTTSVLYAEAREKFGLPAEPWGTVSPYYYLCTEPRGHILIGVLVEKLVQDNVRTASAYEQMLVQHPDYKHFPSLDNIADGYYEGFKSFTEIVEKNFPQRRIRR
jgi:hypothetical protein